MFRLNRLFSAFLLPLLALGFLGVLASEVQAKPEVSAARFGHHPDKTRFVLELSEAPAYRIFTLPDPFRVVIDLPEFDWQLPPSPGPRVSGLVSDLRHGLFAPGISRIVLDVKNPVQIKAVAILPPTIDVPRHRLVVDLAEVERAVFFADNFRKSVESNPPLKALPQTASVQATPSPAEHPTPLIVVDAGHGGVDPGAISKSGLYEKDLVLEYARELKHQLLATKRYRVLMTRDKDIVIPLRDRVKIAQDNKGDLFVSLHANTHPKPKVSGASVYTISTKGASDAEAEALAAKENSADILVGVNFSTQNEDVREILFDLIQRETMNLSKNFANQLVSSLKGSVNLLGNTHRSAGFVVLKSPSIPSVLVEIGYLSNPEEEAKMRQAGYRKSLVAAMVKAIDRYFAWQEQMSRS